MVVLASTLFGKISPFFDSTIGRQHKPRAVLAPINEIKYLFGDLAVHRHGRPVVDDPHFAGQETFEDLIERTLVLRARICLCVNVAKC